MDDKVDRAIGLAKTGKLVKARHLLIEKVMNNPDDLRAWYLLSQVIGSRERAIQCLEQILKRDPENSQALKRLETFRQAPEGGSQEGTASSQPSTGDRLPDSVLPPAADEPTLIVRPPSAEVRQTYEVTPNNEMPPGLDESQAYDETMDDYQMSSTRVPPFTEMPPAPDAPLANEEATHDDQPPSTELPPSTEVLPASDVSQFTDKPPDRDESPALNEPAGAIRTQPPDKPIDLEQKTVVSQRPAAKQPPAPSRPSSASLPEPKAPVTFEAAIRKQNLLIAVVGLVVMTVSCLAWLTAAGGIWYVQSRENKPLLPTLIPTATESVSLRCPDSPQTDQAMAAINENIQAYLIISGEIDANTNQADIFDGYIESIEQAESRLLSTDMPDCLDKAKLLLLEADDNTVRSFKAFIDGDRDLALSYLETAKNKINSVNLEFEKVKPE